MGIKPTNDELEQRIDLVEELLVQGYRTSEIKRAVRLKYGRLSHTTVQAYILRARKRFTDAANGVTTEQRVHELDAMTRRVIRDKDSKPRDKIAALSLLADLTGSKRSRVEVSGPDGVALPVAQPVAVAIYLPENGRAQRG